nr:MAG TPA: hypothetical protein [Herelleviridae sp.]
MRRRIDLLIVTNNIKKKNMETKFKEGDVVRIKSLDWYNNNKDKNGNVVVTGYSCSFTKALSEFCGKCFVIEKVEDTGGIYLNDLPYVFYEWMFEPGKYELKSLDITKNSVATNNPFIFNSAKKPISVCGVISVPLYIAVKVRETPKFQPFQKVLVKDCEEGIFGVWHCDLFSHTSKEGKYFTSSGMWDECIPFEGNEHLIGTKDDPKKQ